MGVLDSFLPMASLDVVDLIALVIALLLTLAIFVPWTLLPTGGAIVVIIFLIYFFYPSIKQTRNYELISRSPLYSQFSATLSGIIIIRSYKQVEHINEKFRDYLNNNLKGTYSYSVTSRVLGFYVDLAYNIAGIGNIFLLLAVGGDGAATASFGLILIVSVTGILQYTIRQMIQTHLLMASAARIQSYCETPSEAAITLPEDEKVKKEGWPQKGEIDLNKVYMRYRPDTDYVIRDLSLHANSGEKIGCIGRTGAGKSSIIQILFRMVEIDKNGEGTQDSSIKIDNVDTQSLGLHLLRNSISIIPQTPFIFRGSVKKNLDPIGTHSDEDLWRALEDVNLKEHVENLDDKLNTDMTNASSVFSVGQKQLVCLARTLLKQSKVLVLDEATANVDLQTDNFIQQKIMEKFSQCTLFTIAHRLSTIANYDKVLVLDKGKKVEFDRPYKLLVKNIGDETITNEQGHFASMVLNTGAKTAQEIFNVAKEHFEKKEGVGERKGGDGNMGDQGDGQSQDGSRLDIPVERERKI
jgi:ATP-binding cassette subfamily C (CFTR/MRP) protein 4